MSIKILGVGLDMGEIYTPVFERLYEVIIDSEEVFGTVGLCYPPSSA